MPFLVELGVMTREGKVRAPRYDKFRQVNRFLELVEDVLPALPPGPLRIVDFGSGKSYLTFALHHLLTSVHGRAVEIVGLDLKPEVVARCEELARRLGADGLRFELGDIGGYDELAGVDLVVSLHACDTATDHALDRAVRAGAPVILAVPCCQHELLPQLCRPALDPLLRHGTLRERFAAEVTDAARAQLLGAVGYDVQVLEFVELEHTPKNVLLRAVARPGRNTAKAWADYRAFAAELGIDPDARQAARGQAAGVSSISTCSASSLAAGERLAGTATQGVSWLLVEIRGAWGRDAVAESGLTPAVRDVLQGFPGKVALVRRPDRRRGTTLIRATVDETGGTALRQELESLDALPRADLGAGEPVAAPIILVCAHGRRDPCCARLGLPLFDALAPHVAPEQLWQSSHLGGHRFAPNVLVLPQGVQLGRIPVWRASEVAEKLASARIPLDLYRGRTMYAPAVQAAELCVRAAAGLDGLTDLRLVRHEGDLVTFSTPAGERAARVEQRDGPEIPVSCGADPEPTALWVASIESAA